MSIDPNKTDRSLPQLFADLSRETVELVRKEMALARAEVSEKITTAERGIVSIAIGAAIILAGVLILLQALVNGVAQLLPPDLAPWLAPLLVGIVISIIGYVMLKSGRAHLQPDRLIPHRTMNSLNRDKSLGQKAMGREVMQ